MTVSCAGGIAFGDVAGDLIAIAMRGTPASARGPGALQHGGDLRDAGAGNQRVVQLNGADAHL